MSNYHDQIMRLPHGGGLPESREPRTAYKQGHRDARHAAAEIALGAETEIDLLRKERDALRAENERLRQLLPVTWESESGATLTVREDAEWLTHESHQPPADLAPAQLVATEAETGPWPVMRVDVIGWYPGLRYRPALSASGLPLFDDGGSHDDTQE